MEMTEEQWHAALTFHGDVADFHRLIDNFRVIESRLFRYSVTYRVKLNDQQMESEFVSHHL